MAERTSNEDSGEGGKFKDHVLRHLEVNSVARLTMLELTGSYDPAPEAGYKQDDVKVCRRRRESSGREDGRSGRGGRNRKHIGAERAYFDVGAWSVHHANSSSTFRSLKSQLQPRAQG